MEAHFAATRRHRNDRIGNLLASLRAVIVILKSSRSSGRVRLQIAQLLQIHAANFGQFVVIATIFEIRKGPLEGLKPALAITRDEIRIDSLSDIYLLSKPFGRRQDDLVVIQISRIEIDLPAG